MIFSLLGATISLIILYLFNRRSKRESEAMDKCLYEYLWKTTQKEPIIIDERKNNYYK